MKPHLIMLVLCGLTASAFAQGAKARRSDGTECTAFPCVVASVTLVDQHVPAVQVPIFTPETDGTFSVSIYMNTVKNAEAREVWSFQLAWTDDDRARLLPGMVPVPGYGPYLAPIILREIAGQPISYSLRPSAGEAAKSTYNLYITVEQLQ